MKVIILATTLAALCVANCFAAFDLPDCNNPGEGDLQLFAKPDNCSQYYECDNGVVKTMDCPPGLEFNDANKTCDYKWAAHCTVQTRVLAIVRRSAEDDLPDCNAPGEGDLQLFAKPDNCSQYYECDNGVVKTMDCPPGLEFNDANKTCDYESSAHCNETRVLAIVRRSTADDLPDCNDPGEGDLQLFAKPDNCSQYYECDNGVVKTMDCPPGLEFNNANKTCDFKWSAHCKVETHVVSLEGDASILTDDLRTELYQLLSELVLDSSEE